MAVTWSWETASDSAAAAAKYASTWVDMCTEPSGFSGRARWDGRAIPQAAVEQSCDDGPWHDAVQR